MEVDRKQNICKTYEVQRIHPSDPRDSQLFPPKRHYQPSSCLLSLGAEVFSTQETIICLAGRSRKSKFPSQPLLSPGETYLELRV